MFFFFLEMFMLRDYLLYLVRKLQNCSAKPQKPPRGMNDILQNSRCGYAISL